MNLPQKAQLSSGLNIRYSLPIILLFVLLFTNTSVSASKTVVNSDGSTVLFNDDGSMRVYPDSPDAAADYLLNYAMTYSETDLEKSKLLIFDSDIKYIENLIESSKKGCIKKEIYDCDNTVKEYQDALLKLTNVQSRQTGKPPLSIDTSSVSLEDGEKTKPSALSQLYSWAKEIKDFLAKLLTGWLP